MGGDPAPGGTVPVSAQCPPCRAGGAPCVGAGGSAALLLRWQRLQTQPAPGPDAGGISHALLSSLRGGGGADGCSWHFQHARHFGERLACEMGSCRGGLQQAGLSSRAPLGAPLWGEAAKMMLEVWGCPP